VDEGRGTRRNVHDGTPGVRTSDVMHILTAHSTGLATAPEPAAVKGDANAMDHSLVCVLVSGGRRLRRPRNADLLMDGTRPGPAGPSAPGDPPVTNNRRFHANGRGPSRRRMSPVDGDWARRAKIKKCARVDGRGPSDGVRVELAEGKYREGRCIARTDYLGTASRAWQQGPCGLTPLHYRHVLSLFVCSCPACPSLGSMVNNEPRLL
jgi:hypothetical protein